MTSSATPPEPSCLNTFYARHPQFILGPVFLAVCLALWPHGMTTWGSEAITYVAFSILLQFAIHGWMCCYEAILQQGKLQHDAPFVHGPAGIATRQTAVLLSNIVYIFVPLRPVSQSWCHFVLSLTAFALCWDAYFFICHRAFHKSMRLYKHFHKLHHRIREPMCFSAYYVTYQSHLVTEQLVVACASYLFVPRDVLIYYLYYSLFETFMQHAGVEIDHVHVPLLPFLTVGHVRALLSLYGRPFGAYTTAHHDWHHEKNSKNYALAFTYLDKLAGTHFVGRPLVLVPPAPTAAATLFTNPRSGGEENNAEGEHAHVALVAPPPAAAPPKIFRRQMSGG